MTDHLYVGLGALVTIGTGLAAYLTAVTWHLILTSATLGEIVAYSIALLALAYVTFLGIVVSVAWWSV